SACGAVETWRWSAAPTARSSPSSPANTTWKPPSATWTASSSTRSSRRRKPASEGHTTLRPPASTGGPGSLLDDDGGSHAEHAVRLLDVAEDVAVPGPGADRVAVHPHGVGRGGGDAAGVRPAGAGPREPVLGEDQLARAVHVHGVGLQALVVVVEHEPVALLEEVGLGGGEGLPVEGEPDVAGVVEDHRELVDDLDVLGDGDHAHRLAI